MITVSTLDRPDQVPAASGAWPVASVDVEWTKNYTIKNGNRPFCLSVTYLTPGPRDLATASFEYTSVYLEPDEPETELITYADRLLTNILDRARLLTGHQISSDFAVLTAAAKAPADGIEQARSAWHQRRTHAEGPRFIDTRYDSGHLLTGRSRRLVDVAAELRLDVTQPELRGTSMTALHRAWLTTGDTAARERVSVLNLRHSLSTALIAARTADLGHWTGQLNVNRMIAQRAAGAWAWLDSPTYQALIKEES